MDGKWKAIWDLAKKVKIFGLENKKKQRQIRHCDCFLFFPVVNYFMILMTENVNEKTYLNVQCEAENTSYCEDPEGYPEKIILDLLTLSPAWINSGIFQKSSSQGRRYLRQPAATELT